MAAECADTRLVPFALSREHRWVVHAVLLDHVELAIGVGADPEGLECERRVIEALEAGDSAFTVPELDRVRHELASHARAFGTAERDREIAERLVERLDGLLAARPRKPS